MTEYEKLIQLLKENMADDKAIHLIYYFALVYINEKKLQKQKENKSLK